LWEEEKELERKSSIDRANVRGKAKTKNSWGHKNPEPEKKGNGTEMKKQKADFLRPGGYPRKKKRESPTEVKGSLWRGTSGTPQEWETKGDCEGEVFWRGTKDLPSKKGKKKKNHKQQVTTKPVWGGRRRKTMKLKRGTGVEDHGGYRESGRGDPGPCLNFLWVLPGQVFSPRPTLHNVLNPLRGMPSTLGKTRGKVRATIESGGRTGDTRTSKRPVGDQKRRGAWYKTSLQKEGFTPPQRQKRGE